MEASVNIDVASLDALHRRALEEVIGHALAANQRLIVSVIEVELPSTTAPRPSQTLDDWTHVYDGLSDEEIEAIDAVAKTRANLTRDLP